MRPGRQSFFAGAAGAALFVSVEDELAPEAPLDAPPPSDDFDSVLLDPSLAFEPVAPVLEDGLDEEYRSAYQPPPLRMKLPPLIWRWAVSFWHLGHTVRGGAEMRCTSSHWFWQLEQAYS